MLIPLSWLQDYLSIDLSPREISDIMTLAGLEVDQIIEKSFSFSNIIIGKITQVSPHPSRKNLKVAQVFEGKNHLQVVCGAPNCREGLITAFAKIGATLTDASGKITKIKKVTLDQVESYGMLCSEKELLLSEAHDKIMELPFDFPLGANLTDLLGDVIIEASLTPNLGHCMSIYGVARDLAAILDIPCKHPSMPLIEMQEKKTKEMIQIEVKEKKGCSRYLTRLIQNVQVAPSPLWLQNRLQSAGIRSINNVVDATNYVMLALGLPIHAFDYDKIAGHRIKIDQTQTDISFVTLDGKTLKVPPSTLMVWDQEKPIAIAGIMGGANSEVTENSLHILLEAAHFHGSFIRKASRSMRLRSEASSRFERGIDHEAIPQALDEAASLIQKIAHGEVLKEKIDCNIQPYVPKKILCRLYYVNQILGTTFSLGEIESFLKRLEMTILFQDEEKLEVRVPSYRNDIEEEIDLIEEIARIYGYNNINLSKKRIIPSSLPPAPLFLVEQKMRTLLLREGLQEFLTCDLISPKLSQLFLEQALPEEEQIQVLHPSSVDQSVLRSSLLPGLLAATKKNFDHQCFDISAFEIGRIHFKEKGHFKEQLTAAIILTGHQAPHSWNQHSKKVDFFDLKGIIENVLENYGIKKTSFVPSNLQSFHPYKQALIQSHEIQIGILGEIHPKTTRLFLNVSNPLFFAQINLHTLFELNPGFPQITPLPQFPGSDRDWTFTLNKDISIQSILDVVVHIPSKLLKQVFLLDIYEDEKMENTEQNITLRFIYRDDKKTLVQKQVEKEHHRLIELIAKKFQLPSLG